MALSIPFRSLACAGLLAIGFTSASGQSLEKSFEAFTACNGSFFKTIDTQADAWRAVTSIAGDEGRAWVKSPDRNSATGNVVELAGKPVVAGVTLTHYLDESKSLGTLGLYYFWGFKASGTVDSVLEQLKPLIFHNNRLRKDNDGYVRTEVKVGDRPWVAVATQSGKVPRLFSIERALTIENDADVPNTVKVLCSIQGDVTTDVLKNIRPDIAVTEYPVQLNPNLFEETPANAQVMQVVQSATDGKDYWKPKFKRLEYAYATRGDDVKVELVSRADGLVSVSEDYKVFTVKRLTSGGLVQLASRMNRNQAVNLTDNLSFELPGALQNGAQLKFRQTSNDAPLGPGSVPHTVGMACEVGNALDASKIFATLTGQAVILSCTDIDNKKVDGKVFLKDLGVVIDYTPEPLFIGYAKPSYRRFIVER